MQRTSHTEISRLQSMAYNTGWLSSSPTVAAGDVQVRTGVVTVDWSPDTRCFTLLTIHCLVLLPENGKVGVGDRNSFHSVPSNVFVIRTTNTSGVTRVKVPNPGRYPPENLQVQEVGDIVCELKMKKSSLAKITAARVR